MKKLILTLGVIFGFCAVIFSQTNVIAPVNAEDEEQPDSVPVIVVVEEMQIDSVPLFTGSDMGMLLTDTVPTPQWMTMQLLEVGAIEPSQINQANKINTRFVHRVQDLAAKKRVSNSAMKGAAGAQDDELKAVLSDKQEQAYQTVKDKIHKRAWHHYCKQCRCMMGNGNWQQ